MTDAECIAYTKTIYIAEQQRIDLEHNYEFVRKGLIKKYNMKNLDNLDCADKLKDIPEYKEIAQKLVNAEKAGLNLFRQALQCNPDNEQLRSLCAGSIYICMMPVSLCRNQFV